MGMLATMHDEIAQRNAALAGLIREKLGVGGSGLEASLRRAGRDLPRYVRRAGRDLVRAEQMAGHPKLARQLDLAGLARAEKQCRSYLKSIDAADRRKGRILGILGVIAFNLLLLAAAVVTYLAMTGRIGPQG